MKFLRSTLLASTLFMTVPLFAQNKDSLRLDQKIKTIPKILEQKRAITPVATTEKPQTKAVDLGTLPSLTAASTYDDTKKMYDVRDLIAANKKATHISYADAKGIKYYIAKSDLSEMLAAYEATAKKKNIDKPRLLLAVTQEYNMAVMHKNFKSGLNMADPSFNDVYMTTTMLEYVDKQVVMDAYAHETKHFQQHERADFDPYNCGNEIEADDAMMEEVGFDRAQTVILTLYQSQKEALEKRYEAPKDSLQRKQVARQFDWHKQFSLDEKNTYPPYSVRELMLEVLDEKNKGQPVLYDYLKRWYRF